MSKDPAFLFYPGDYLRDTQCLSEKAQVAYDRLMCEHMRNICISQAQLDFFTKRLTPDEKSELLMVLTKISGGFQISWVAESIEKRREYSESRRKNRTPKEKKKPDQQQKDMKTYVKHMENENVNEDEILNEYSNWTNSILDRNDFLFWNKFRNEQIPESDNTDFWIRDHLDLLNRYPKMRPPNQGAFRRSCLKHIRENYKKQINGTGKKNGLDVKSEIESIYSRNQ